MFICVLSVFVVLLFAVCAACFLVFCYFSVV